MCLFIIIISVSFWPKKGNADHVFFERCERIDETPSHFFLWSFFIEQHCFELLRAWRWLMNVWYCDLHSKIMNHWMISPYILVCPNVWWMQFETMLINWKEWQTRISMSHVVVLFYISFFLLLLLFLFLFILSILFSTMIWYVSVEDTIFPDDKKKMNDMNESDCLWNDGKISTNFEHKPIFLFIQRFIMKESHNKIK